MSPSGKAPGSGPGIRGFESLHPSHKNRLTFWWVVFYNLAVGIQNTECIFGGEKCQWHFESDVPMTINRQS